MSFARCTQHAESH